MVNHMEQDIGLDVEANIGAQPKFGDDGFQYLKLTKKFKVPLYTKSDLNILTRTLMLLNTCVIHRASNGFVDELFSLFCNSIIPKPNHLPKSNYEAKKMIQNLG
jgi:hypothetical protein